MLGLQNVGPYMQKNQAQKLEDWSAVPLDNEGKQIQETMTRKFQVLSLRPHWGPNFVTNSRSSNYL
jgi:exportin-5